MGSYLAPTIDARLEEVQASLRKARKRYQTLQHQDSEYGRDIRDYIGCMEAVERIWQEARARGEEAQR